MGTKEELKTVHTGKMKLFILGYADNTMTDYILDYFVRHGLAVDGGIFITSDWKTSRTRLLSKVSARGVRAAGARVFENLLVRRRGILHAARANLAALYFVDNVNSVEVRDILTTNQVQVLVLTSTPIIKSIILDIEGLTILNAHTGWLPRYRGLDANIKAMRDGHHLGVSIHKVTNEIDAGEIYLRSKFESDFQSDILRQMDTMELELSAQLYVEAIRLMNENKLEALALDEPLGEYEPRLTRREIQKILEEARRANVR